jgi:hypothetical protein
MLSLVTNVKKRLVQELAPELRRPNRASRELNLELCSHAALRKILPNQANSSANFGNIPHLLHDRICRIDFF